MCPDCRVLWCFDCRSENAARCICCAKDSRQVWVCLKCAHQGHAYDGIEVEERAGKVLLCHKQSGFCLQHRKKMCDAEPCSICGLCDLCNIPVQGECFIRGCSVTEELIVCMHHYDQKRERARVFPGQILHSCSRCNEVSCISAHGGTCVFCSNVPLCCNCLDDVPSCTACENATGLRAHFPAVLTREILKYCGQPRKESKTILNEDNGSDE